ncbi:hypothetical protein PENTCL1PPCAC_2415 [Pristionchus entomophagus]|uniref:Uncharacterized protein n=1 Tax=Pristionchus entomophagus TaxID=358040 RepID=A0AAV5SBL7_9BILA|nr:hypothetical protein PENTCL1PPCAC_2415 [Pristionchus entomophagus]
MKSPGRVVTNYSNECVSPRIRDLPRSAIAQRILKEQSASTGHFPMDDESPLTSVSRHFDSVEDEEVTIEDVEVIEEMECLPLEQTLSQRKSQQVILSTQPIIVSSSRPCSTPAHQTNLIQELCRLMPTLVDVTVPPVNAYSSVCDKTTEDSIDTSNYSIHCTGDGAASARFRVHDERAYGNRRPWNTICPSHSIDCFHSGYQLEIRLESY